MEWQIESRPGMNRVFDFIAANPGRVKTPPDALEAFDNNELPPFSHLAFWVYTLYGLGQLVKDVNGAYYATPGVRR